MSNKSNNLQAFNAYVAMQRVSASAFGAKLWQEFDIEGLRALASTPVSTLSDIALEEVYAKFSWHNENSLGSKRETFLAELRNARFQNLCELLGRADSISEGIEDDFWDFAAGEGISRDVAREAADSVEMAAQGEAALEAFVAQCSAESTERGEREAASWTELNGVKYKVVDRAPVLWAGWECDHHALLGQKGDQLVLVTTNHGSPEEGNLPLLQAKLVEYEEALAATRRLLAALTAKKPSFNQAAP
jgi:hypothetical protein